MIPSRVSHCICLLHIFHLCLSFSSLPQIFFFGGTESIIQVPIYFPTITCIIWGLSVVKHFPSKLLWQPIKSIKYPWASLVAQWLRIRLPMQGTRVRALVREDPTCRGATKPLRHNYWACALEPANHNCWAHVPQLLKPACLDPALRNKRSHRNEKPVHSNEE